MNCRLLHTLPFFALAAFIPPLLAQEAQQTLESTVVESQRPAPRPAPVRRTAPAPAPAPAPVESEPLIISDSFHQASLGTITDLELQMTNATDLEDVFGRTPSVTVNGGRAQGQQIHVYNLESNLLNVTVDGASQGNLFHHQSTVLIEPELLKQVEVVAGNANALDGPGALGGAIKFETKNAFDLLSCGGPVVINDAKQPVGKNPVWSGKNPSGKDVVHADTLDDFGGYLKGTAYGNGDGWKGAGAVYGLFNDHWGYLLAGSVTDRGTYEDGNGNEVENSDFHRESLLFKISGRGDEGHSLDLSFEHFSDETFAYDRVNIAPAWLAASGRPPGLLQKMQTTRQTIALSYDFDPDWNDALDLETNFFHTTQDFNRSLSGERSEIAITGLDVRNATTIGSLETTYGFDYQDKEASTTYIFRNPGGNETESVFGGYLQSTLPVTSLFELTGGVRYDRYDYTDIAGQNFQSDEISPNVALTVKPVEDFSVTIGHSEAYRGVGIRESFLPGARPATLDGEDSDTQKLIYRYDNGAFYSSGAVFRQEIANYIYPNGFRGDASYGDIQNEGYEFEAGIRRNGFHASLGVFHSDPETVGYDYPDDFGMVVAGRRWVADTGYTFENLGVTVGWTVEIREAVAEVPLPGGGPFPAVAGKGSYTVNNFYVAWNVPTCEGLSATLNVDNILDEFYQDHTIYTGSGLASPGREVRLGLSYQF